MTAKEVDGSAARKARSRERVRAQMGFQGALRRSLNQRLSCIEVEGW